MKEDESSAAVAQGIRHQLMHFVAYVLGAAGEQHLPPGQPRVNTVRGMIVCGKAVCVGVEYPTLGRSYGHLLEVFRWAAGR